MGAQVVGNNLDCAVATLGSLVLLFWRKKIVAHGVQWTRKAFLDAGATERLGFLTVLDARCDLATSSDVRHDLGELLSSNQDRIAGTTIIFEGQGFRMTLVRSIVTGINIASRTRFPHSVFSDVKPAAEWMVRRDWRGAERPEAGAIVRAIDELREL